MAEPGTRDRDSRSNRGGKRLLDWWQAPGIRVLSGFIALLVIGLSLFASFTVSGVFDAYAELMEAQSQYATCSSAAAELQEASDYLFTKARSFVVTGERKHLDDYVNEMSVNNRRGNAVQTLEEYLMGTVAHLELLQANMQSNALSQLELKAIKLAASGYGITDLPDEVASIQLSDDLVALSPSKKVKEAQQILFGDSYEEQKRGIDSLVDECATSLIESLEQEESRCEARVSELLGRLRVAILLFLASVLLSIWITIHYLVNPMLGFAENINQDEPLKQTGAREVRYVAAAYNAMYERNKAQTDALRREAERDAMTGLLNRGSYDRILEETAGSKALILVDVDLFKLVNDKYGHEMGDAVLKRVATVLEHAFRSSDFVCRVGGDEFAVIMVGILSSQRYVIERKLRDIAEQLRVPEGGLPSTKLSVGVAISEDVDEGEGLFNAADAALYRVKQSGRDGFAFSS